MQSVLEMSLPSKIRLLLLKHGTCQACKDRPTLDICQECFNTRLKPEVLEGITALHLAEKLKEDQDGSFDGASGDYGKPSEGGYFYHVMKKKEMLEATYQQGANSGGGEDQEREVFRKLMGRLGTPA